MYGGMDGYSWVSGWIGLGQKPIPTLPNAFLGRRKIHPRVGLILRVTGFWANSTPNPAYPNKALG
jgi:hypothetical protein